MKGSLLSLVLDTSSLPTNPFGPSVSLCRFEGDFMLTRILAGTGLVRITHQAAIP
jgi:hypothetical protein